MSKEGSTTVTLGDIAENISVRVDDPSKSGLDRFVGLKHLDSGSVTVTRWGPTESVTSSMKRFEAGDVLLARRNAHLRRASAADFDGVCSGDAYVLREKPDAIVPGLLKYILNTNRLWEYAIANADGSMSTRVKWKHLEKYELEINYDSQMELVGILDELNNNHLGNKRIFLDLEKLRKSIPHSLIFGKSRDSNFECPPGWEIMECIDLLEIPPMNGFSPSLSRDGVDFHSLSIGAIRNGSLNVLGHQKPVKLTQQEYGKYALKDKDVLVVRGNGNMRLCGKSGIASGSFNDTIYPDLLIRLRFNPDKILPEFANILWNIPEVHRMLISKAKSTNGIWKVNGQDISKHKLIVPPMGTQIECVRYVRAVKQGLEAVNENLETIIQALKSVVEVI